MEVDEHIKVVLELAQDRFSQAQAHQIGFAAVYASKAHSKQKRKSGEDFIHHPLRVATTILKLPDPRVDDVSVIAAILHDVVEDTNKTLDTIHLQFGRDVVKLVDALTKRPDPTDQQKEDMQYYEQIRQAAKNDARVALVKLADQLDNAQDLEVHKPQRRKEKLTAITDVFIPLAKQIESPYFVEKLQEALQKYQE